MQIHCLYTKARKLHNHVYRVQIQAYPLINLAKAN